MATLAQVQDAIASALVAASVVPRAVGYPVEEIDPPIGVVGYPDVLTFDLTMQRGADSMQLPVFIVVGRTYERGARDKVSAAIDGATGVKQVLDGNLGGVVDSLRVTDMRIIGLQVAGVDYLAGLFTTEVIF